MTYCLFDFGEELKIKESFSEIEINGIPIRESYDENRVGYQRKNTKSLNFNISRIRLLNSLIKVITSALDILGIKTIDKM
jgi:hypothetical protein